MSSDTHETTPDGEVAVHAVPPSTLLGVYGLLIVGTVITVVASRIDLGEFNIWVALAIALVKASLVVLYFMHLRWDSPFNGIILLAALLFVCLFIGFAILDSHTYQPILKATPTSP